MAIEIYNTLSRRTEPFEPIEPGLVKMYVCGVTVYDTAHIGHAMSALVFDVVRRYLEWRGYRVDHVVNFTDVDDKIINRANALGRDAKEYIAEFPVERLRELHNTGLGLENGRLMDHLPLTADDWDFFDWALDHILSGTWPEPWALAYEYGGIGPKFERRSERAALAADIPRFWSLLEPTRSAGS